METTVFTFFCTKSALVTPSVRYVRIPITMKPSYHTAAFCFVKFEDAGERGGEIHRKIVKSGVR